MGRYKINTAFIGLDCMDEKILRIAREVTGVTQSWFGFALTTVAPFPDNLLRVACANCLPPLIKESELGSYHYSCDLTFELKDTGKLILQTRINKYLGERQYEVILPREASARKTLYE